jgi:O-antigen/teichoic acid export membrane protein
MPLLVRLLGPQNYGSYVLIQGALGIGLLIFSQNLYVYTRRQIPGCTKEDQYGYFKTLLVLIFICFFCIMFIIKLLHYDELLVSIVGIEESYLFLVLILVCLQLLTTEFARFNIALQEIEVKNIGIFVRTFGYSILIIISGLILDEFVIANVLLMLIFAELFSLLYYLIRFDLGTFIKSSLKIDLLTKGYWYALPLYPVGLSTMIIIYIDRYLLKIMKDLVDVGQYGFAMNIINVATGLIGTSLTLTIFPYATEAQNKNNIFERNKLLCVNIRYGVLFTLFFYVFLVINRDWIVHLIGGIQYEPAKFILLIIGIYPLLQIVNSVTSHHLQLINRIRIQAILYPTFLFMAFCLSFFFIKFFGLVGAAVSSVLSLFIMAVINILVMIHYDNSMKNDLMAKPMLGLVLTCLLMVVSSLFLELIMIDNLFWIFVKNVILFVLSVFALVLSGCILHEEKQFILALLHLRKINLSN